MSASHSLGAGSSAFPKAPFGGREVGEVSRRRQKRVPIRGVPKRDRRFESALLQRRVQCEPYFPIHLAPGPAGRRALQLRSFAAARQYLAFADMVGGGDDAFRFHPFDNPSCAVVADLKVALHKARRSLAFAAHHRDGLRI